MEELIGVAPGVISFLKTGSVPLAWGLLIYFFVVQGIKPLIGTRSERTFAQDRKAVNRATKVITEGLPERLDKFTDLISKLASKLESIHLNLAKIDSGVDQISNDVAAIKRVIEE